MVTEKTDKTGKDGNEDFLKELFDKALAPPKISALCVYYSDIDSRSDPGPLKRILGLDDDFFSDRETRVLAILENEHEADRSKTYSQFKWKVFAFLSVQDVFDAPLVQGNDLLSLFRQWYFYYESKYLLIESILCGLNGFMGAVGSLLRLFLEFNLLQHFFFRNIDNTSSYQVLEDYCTKGVNPNWNTVINGAMPANSFTKPIKKRIQLHLRSLAENGSHPYHPTFAQQRTGSGLPEPTLERIFFHAWLSLILEPVLWLYYVNFPMFFQGVNIERKFGFSGPVGIFVDEQVTKIIRKTLNEGDFNAFCQNSRRQQKVLDLLRSYGEGKDMTDEEILQTWNIKDEGPITNIVQGHVMQTAKMRALREAMALQIDDHPKELPVGHEEEIFNRLSSYEWWRASYKRMR